MQNFSRSPKDSPLQTLVGGHAGWSPRAKTPAAKLGLKNLYFKETDAVLLPFYIL